MNGITDASGSYAFPALGVSIALSSDNPAAAAVIAAPAAAAAQYAADKWDARATDLISVSNRHEATREKLALASTVLSGLIGTYGLIRQHGIISEYLKLAKEQTAQADRYLKLAESNYNDISVPTFKAQEGLFNRYLSQFGGYETRFLADAFKFDEYTPDYKLQEGRAINTVQVQFDKAQLQRRRQVGRYNTGRACHDATMFGIARATAKVAAINHAYRFEESRKFKLDQWYWSRKVAGVGVVDSMRGNVISGLNGGSAGATSGINAISSAVGAKSQVFQNVENGYTNLANFYGSIANNGFSVAGFQLGRSAVSPFTGGSSGMGGTLESLGSAGAAQGASAGAYGITGSTGIY